MIEKVIDFLDVKRYEILDDINFSEFLVEKTNIKLIISQFILLNMLANSLIE